MPGNPNSLLKLDLGGFAKPATVLIEKISNAVGAVFEPYQIVRVARAEAEAEKIQAENRIEVTNLERRAMLRWLKEEARKQSNIEEITRGALPFLNENAKPENVGDDWITYFFDKSRSISEEEMQRLWSSVLAGEANQPGSFSKRTVNLLADLDKADAELFTQLCCFGWRVEGHELPQLKGQGITEIILHVVPVILNCDDDIYTTRGIDYGSLGHLANLGLIKFSDVPMSYWWGGMPPKFSLFYFDKQIDFAFAEPNYLPRVKGKEYGIPIGCALLSRAGLELAPLVKANPVDGFFEYAQRYWERWQRPPKPSKDTEGTISQSSVK